MHGMVLQFVIYVPGLRSCSSPDLPLDEALDQREDPPKRALRKSEP